MKKVLAVAALVAVVGFAVSVWAFGGIKVPTKGSDLPTSTSDVVKQGGDVAQNKCNSDFKSTYNRDNKYSIKNYDSWKKNIPDEDCKASFKEESRSKSYVSFRCQNYAKFGGMRGSCNKTNCSITCYDRNID